MCLRACKAAPGHARTRLAVPVACLWRTQASRAAKQATLRAAADTAKLQSSRSLANATLAAQARARRAKDARK
eukprot:2311535-Pleurochrysis_carterae.AAC.1